MMKKSLLKEIHIIFILMSFFSMSVQYTITFGETNDDLVIMSNGVILCTKYVGYSEYIPVEVNSFRPGDEIIFYNKVNVTKQEGKGINLNLTWRLKIINPFNLTIYEKSTHALYNNDESVSVSYSVHFFWNVTSKCVDGTYKVVLTISESFSGQSRVHRTFFKLYGGLSQTQRYHLNHTIILKNPKQVRARITRLYVAELPDLKGYQRVLEGPLFNLEPSEWIQDQFGNKYAVFDKFWLDAEETFNLTAAYVVEVNVSYIDYLEASILDLNKTDLSMFLRPQKYIESDAPEIISLAKILVGNESNVFNIGKAIFDYTSTHIIYDEEWESYGSEWREGQEGALWTYRNNRGLCRHFSAFYVALARSLGVPSVVVSGYGWLDLEVEKPHEKTTGHSWVLIYIPGYGWMPLEPQGGLQYGSSLPSHIIFVKGEFSKFQTDEGEAQVGRLVLWRDPSSEVEYNDVIKYIVEPVRPKRQEVSMNTNLTSMVYGGENFELRCRLGVPIDGLVLITITSPIGKTDQECGKFKRGEAYFEWMVPADRKSIGKWNVSIAFPGDESYEWCLVKSFFNVSSAPSKINLSVSPENPVKNQPLEIRGNLNPPFSGENVTVTIISEEGERHIHSVKTVEGGYFHLDLSDGLPLAGKWTVNANWAGGVRGPLYASASNSSTFNTRSLSSITCSVSSGSINIGKYITVTGSLSPELKDRTVTVIYTKPDGSTFTRTVTTSSDGSYSDSYTPTETGSWSLKSSWKGDAEYQGASSSPVSFTVEAKKGCMIATATYGSELAPEVQFLRGFRDNSVLKTFAGKNFMTVFNAWYYSFSPSVAGFIAQQPVMKTIMKGVLYPLIGILHLSSMTYSAFAFSPEFGVVMAGLAASALIGVIYFSLPTTVLIAIIERLRKKTLRVRQLKPMAIPLLISAALMLLGEITASPMIMMVATAAFVLTTLGSSATIIAARARDKVRKAILF